MNPTTEAIERGRIGKDGTYCPYYGGSNDTTVAWRSCDHDIGYGSCDDCERAGRTYWTHGNDCRHDTWQDALACLAAEHRDADPTPDGSDD